MNETEVVNNSENYSQTYVPQNDAANETRIMVSSLYGEMKKVRSIGIISIVFSLLALIGVIAFGAVILKTQLDQQNELSNLREDQETTMYSVTRLEQMVEDALENANNECNENKNNGEKEPEPEPEPYVFPDWGNEVEKPVIYLYPETDDTYVSVSIGIQDEVKSVTYPKAEKADNGFVWNVIADEDGSLRTAEGREYSYLFWEAEDNTAYDMSKGFCVAGADTAEFLEETLGKIGLTTKERDDFITYWLPRMIGNEYNIISFKGMDPDDEYNKNYPLTITDAEGNTAESVLRIMMAWKAADEKTELEAQEIKGFERNGFTVVEWGGTEIK